MARFSDLPNELLSVIVSQLDATDIDNLHCVPELSSRLQGLVAVISDGPFKHTMIPCKLNFGEVNLTETFMVVIIELHKSLDFHSKLSDTEKQKRVYQVQLSKRISHTTTSHIAIYSERVFGMKQKGPDWTYPRDFANTAKKLCGSRTSKLTFSDINSLKVIKSIDSWPIFLFPSLRSLELNDIDDPTSHKQILSLAKRFDRLTIRASLSGGSTDIIQGSCLKYLSLQKDQKLEVWDAVSLPDVQVIEIKDPKMLTQFSGIVYRRLHRLELSNCRSLRSIHNLTLPSLTALHISTNEILEMANVSAPLLDELRLDAEGLMSFQGVEFSSLSYCDLNITPPPGDGIPNDCSFSWLSTVKTLVTPEISDVLLSCPNVSSLLITSGIEPLMNTNDYRLPELLDVEIDCTIEKHSSWPFKNSKKLQTIRMKAVDGQNPDDSGIFNFLLDPEFDKWHPSLDRFTFKTGYEYSRRTHIRLVMKNVKLTSLTSFSAYDLILDLHDCHFPMLESFTSEFSFEQEQKSNISFTAPELKHFTARGTSIDVLDLRGCNAAAQVDIEPLMM